VAPVGGNGSQLEGEVTDSGERILAGDIECKEGTPHRSSSRWWQSGDQSGDASTATCCRCDGANRGKQGGLRCRLCGEGQGLRLTQPETRGGQRDEGGGLATNANPGAWDRDEGLLQAISRAQRRRAHGGAARFGQKHQDLMECRRGNGCSKARAGRERGEGAKTRSRRMRRKRRINGKTSRGQRCG